MEKEKNMVGSKRNRRRDIIKTGWNGGLILE